MNEMMEEMKKEWITERVKERKHEHNKARKAYRNTSSINKGRKRSGEGGRQEKNGEGMEGRECGMKESIEV